MITKEFITAGHAIFTVEIPEDYRELKQKQGISVKPHYTYKVTHKEAKAPFAEAWFVSMLTGPDNTKDYTYLGMLDKTFGSVRLTQKSFLPEKAVPIVLLRRVLDNIWNNTQVEIARHGFSLHHEGHCGRCGRLLTVPESVSRGIGPECINHI